MRDFYNVPDKVFTSVRAPIRSHYVHTLEIILDILCDMPGTCFMVGLSKTEEIAFLMLGALSENNANSLVSLMTSSSCVRNQVHASSFLESTIPLASG